MNCPAQCKIRLVIQIINDDEGIRESSSVLVGINLLNKQLCDAYLWFTKING